MTISLSDRHLTAFFETDDDANAAIQRLREAGILQADITLMGGAAGSEKAESEKSFWEALGDLFMPSDDREIYDEGLRRGGYMITVTNLADDAVFERVAGILDDEGTIDMDERAAAWRREGWTGNRRADQARSGQSADQGSDETVIPIVEEHLRVGKRDISHSRTRVRSYVVETPVEEDRVRKTQ